jgi:hypothetical protein
LRRFHRKGLSAARTFGFDIGVGVRNDEAIGRGDTEHLDCLDEGNAFLLLKKKGAGV